VAKQGNRPPPSGRRRFAGGAGAIVFRDVVRDSGKRPPPESRQRARGSAGREICVLIGPAGCGKTTRLNTGQ